MYVMTCRWRLKALFDGARDFHAFQYGSCHQGALLTYWPKVMNEALATKVEDMQHDMLYWPSFLQISSAGHNRRGAIWPRTVTHCVSVNASIFHSAPPKREPVPEEATPPNGATASSLTV